MRIHSPAGLNIIVYLGETFIIRKGNDQHNFWINCMTSVYFPEQSVITYISVCKIHTGYVTNSK